MNQVSFSSRALVLCVLTCGVAACTSDADDLSDAGMVQGTVGAPAGSGGVSTPSAGTSGSAGATSVAGGGAGSNSGGAGSTAGGGSGAGSGAGTGGAGPTDAGPALEPFSFFVTSWAAMQRLSGSADGFGGDLRYGEADGLAGADKICTEIAETSMPGSGSKQWRAFLSVTQGPGGGPVHAIDRVGQGPWYDRLGRIVAMTRQALLNTRPMGADPAIIDDLPNEDGVPNKAPDGVEVDNHDMLTGTNNEGQLYSTDWASTCHDWTSAVGSDGRPRVGHSWPRGFGDFGDAGFFGGMPGGPGAGMFPGTPGGGLENFDGENWMSSLDEAGCAAGASLIEMGPPNPNNPTVGSGGGYGGIYCFALTP